MGQIYNKIKIQNTNFIPKFFMATINFWHGVYYDRYTCTCNKRKKHLLTKSQ